MEANQLENGNKSLLREWNGAIWSLIFLAAIASSLLITFGVVGYRWTAELATGLLLIISVLCLDASRRTGLKCARVELSALVVPLILFVIWSGLTIFWAVSSRSVVHHTLLWACYLVFYLTLRQTLNDYGNVENSLKVAGAVILIICAACLIQYFGTPGPIPATFNFRYYLFSEAFVAFIPVFLAIVASYKGKWSVLALIVIALIWLIVLATASRAMFISTIIGIVAFVAIAFFKNNSTLGKRLFIVAVVLAGIALVFMLPQRKTVVDRLSGSEENSVVSSNSRLLFWGIAAEAFKSNPVVGVGADNYFTVYRQARESFAQRDPNSSINEINEDLLPERAHNEYLQILSELGVVGFAIFCWIIFGIFYLFFRAKSPSLVAIGAFAGLVAFLASSSVTSYSFRFPTNGLTFFFLVALAVPYESAERIISRKWIAAGLLIPLTMVVFSAVRGISIYYFARSVGSREPAVAENEMAKAFRFDPTEPMFKAYHAQMLNLWGRSDEALPNLRFAIDKGMANSTTYFSLCGTYRLLGRVDDANKAFQESLRVYPRSVFLRTAYASFLKRNGKQDEAAIQYTIAEMVDGNQARSWQLAHDEGLERLSLTRFNDPSYLKVEQLYPFDGPLVLANFQQVANKD